MAVLVNSCGSYTLLGTLPEPRQAYPNNRIVCREKYLIL
jgi:hypothetical protein